MSLLLLKGFPHPVVVFLIIQLVNTYLIVPRNAPIDQFLPDERAALEMLEEAGDSTRWRVEVESR